LLADGAGFSAPQAQWMLTQLAGLLNWPVTLATRDP
jgi:hypothetical protein